MAQLSRLVGISFFLSVAATASAKVEIRFVESAPKDRFVVTNVGNCELTDLLLEVNLTSTKGQLIFDTTASGAGVEVFQPFEKREGEVNLVSAAQVNDGDKSLTVRIPSIQAQGRVSFTIDVDDTLTNSELGQIRVSGSEMEEGLVTLTQKGFEPVFATFDENSTAILAGIECR